MGGRTACQVHAQVRPFRGGGRYEERIFVTFGRAVSGGTFGDVGLVTAANYQEEIGSVLGVSAARAAAIAAEYPLAIARSGPPGNGDTRVHRVLPTKARQCVGGSRAWRRPLAVECRRGCSVSALRHAGNHALLADVCTHLDTIQVSSLPQSVPGCEDCLRIGGRWVHLRLCLTCGHVGCCDSSPNRHATKHAGSSGHPIIRSLEPGEDWCWCYEDEVMFRVDLPRPDA